MFAFCLSTFVALPLPCLLVQSDQTAVVACKVDTNLRNTLFLFYLFFALLDSSLTTFALFVSRAALFRICHRLIGPYALRMCSAFLCAFNGIAALSCTHSLSAQADLPKEITYHRFLVTLYESVICLNQTLCVCAVELEDFFAFLTFFIIFLLLVLLLHPPPSPVCPLPMNVHSVDASSN